ncbi:hypothetical protein SB8_22795, partial [Pseudomonas oryzihabitans]
MNDLSQPLAATRHAHSTRQVPNVQGSERVISLLGGGLPIIATGHLTTVGASASESVREIYVGSLDAFPTSAFPPADYIALGHIHRPQRVGGLEHVRYSGSPLCL